MLFTCWKQLSKLLRVVPLAAAWARRLVMSIANSDIFIWSRVRLYLIVHVYIYIVVNGIVYEYIWSHMSTCKYIRANIWFYVLYVGFSVLVLSSLLTALFHNFSRNAPLQYEEMFQALFTLIFYGPSFLYLFFVQLKTIARTWFCTISNP